MTLSTMYGNLLNDQISRIETCKPSPLLKTYSMIFIISTYCILLIYLIFVWSVKETMKRYFTLVYVLSDSQVSDYLELEEEDE